MFAGHLENARHDDARPARGGSGAVVAGKPSGLGHSGFSLLELLIALTILAIVLVPVAYFYTKSLQMVEQASIRTRALTLAQERIAEIRQMPYDQIRSNVTPSAEQLRVFGTNPGGQGVIDVTQADWYGYDFETPQGLTPSHPPDAWAGMFLYPLPLDFNPYDPRTQGYDNSVGANHTVPNNALGLPYVNFYSANSLDYEYEPIGFYRDKVYRHNLDLNWDSAAASGARADIRWSDRRTIPAVEPSIARSLTGVTYDYFRSGVEQQLDNYAIYGRRTIILDVLPNPQDTDFQRGDDPRNMPPDSDYDGVPLGPAGLARPYSPAKGPDDKFQQVSRYGSRGKKVIVQVFWLPRGALQGGHAAGQPAHLQPSYVPKEELNMIELVTFVGASSGEVGAQVQSPLDNNDTLFITSP